MLVFFQQLSQLYFMPSKKLVTTDPSSLSQRQTRLLFAIIKEFCDTGENIGSLELKEKYGFDFSPATIRNELVKLRDYGFLYQPFVNSSSVPTEKAFKMFINQLIMGLSHATRQQREMHDQIMDLQNRHENLNKEISRLISSQTDSLSFSVSSKGESVTGMKHLVKNGEANFGTNEIIELLENLDQNKQFLLNSDNKTQTQMNGLKPMFGGDNNIFPISEGFAMVTSEVMIDNEKTVFGIISPTKLLADPKKLQIMNSLAKMLSEEE
jgi:transcriptional regulator of heat shock response